MPGCDSLRISPARRRVFCASLGDVFDKEVDIEWLVELLDLIRQTPNLDWLLLTNRIVRVRGDLAYALRVTIVRQKGPELFKWLGMGTGDFPTSNVWIGATVVNQQEVDRDIPKLLQVP